MFMFGVFLSALLFVSYSTIAFGQEQELVAKAHCEVRTRGLIKNGAQQITQKINGYDKAKLRLKDIKGQTNENGLLCVTALYKVLK